MSRVRVLVVNHNSGPWLARCLDSLQAQTMRDFEVVVIDNASTDGSFDVSLPDARFRLVAAGANLGFAAGNNRAAQGARTRWLAMLNPDAIAEPDWLACLLAETVAHPDCRIFGSTQWRAEQPQQFDGTGDCLSAWGISWRSGHGHPRVEPPPEGEVFAACGAAMLIDTALFEQLGGFETRFFCYVEDVDLCFRARLQGDRVWQSRHARVAHAGGASSGSGESGFSMYHGHRNLFWTHLRCMPLPLLALALSGLAGLMLLRMGLPRRPGQRAALWRGLRDGLGHWREALRERRRIQSQRRVSTWDVARWLAWNPLDALRRPSIRVREAAPKKTPGG